MPDLWTPKGEPTALRLSLESSRQLKAITRFSPNDTNERCQNGTEEMQAKSDIWASCGFLSIDPNEQTYGPPDGTSSVEIVQTTEQRSHFAAAPGAYRSLSIGRSVYRAK